MTSSKNKPDFQTRVSQWANDRNLIRGSDPWTQIKDRRGKMVDGIFVKEN